MIDAFFLSVAQLGDRRFVAVLAKSTALTLALFAVVGIALWYGSAAAAQRWFGYDAGALAAAFAIFVTVLALWLLFRAVAIAVIGIFADEIVAAVEARHYPQALADARAIGVGKSLAIGARSAGRVILVNLALLPVYVALLVTGIGTAALFFLVNGWLLGRDLGDMVAVRHLDDAAMRDWRKATAARRFLLGLAATALFVVPVANLLAPVIGAAMATHLFHRRRR
jgi:uncharacterized protein involved in cysteine biosynthesis